MYSKYEEHFLKIYNRSTVKYRTFPHHVEIVRHWAEKLCDSHPEADRKVVIVAALFHDLGHFVDNHGGDHAVYSELEARKYLKSIKADNDFTDKVAAAIRSHRNADVKPKTIEEKIIVFADSASHITAPDVYLYVAAGKYGKINALEKLERDYRDLGFFPEEKKELKKLYLAWKNIIQIFPEEFYPHIRNVEERL